MKHTLLYGDALERLKELPNESFDACFCDPPYGISFMGKQWDHGVPSKDVWVEVNRILKPGAYCLAFGGTRTFHRLTVNIEDAGFEIRDCCMWLYGSGFPKSFDISKAIDRNAGLDREQIGISSGPNNSQYVGDRYSEKRETRFGTVQDQPIATAPACELAKTWQGYGTALKPAWEPCVVAMKPTEGSFVENALKHGVAGINIDAGRINLNGDYKCVANGRPSQTGLPDNYNKEFANKPDTLGRWPANLILDEESAEMLDEQAGIRESGTLLKTHAPGTDWTAGDISHDRNGGRPPRERDFKGNSGGASRFFYCAKVSKEERESGLQGRKKTLGQSNQAKAEIKRGNDLKGNSGLNTVKYVFNDHPTLKPIDLTRYLAKLILPPERDTPRRIIVPFCGTGSEIIGAMNAGWDEAVGIDNDQESLDTAEQRLVRWLPSLFVNQELMW